MINNHLSETCTTTTTLTAMAQLNIYHVQAKITNYMDLQDYLQTEITGGHGDALINIQLGTLDKIISYLLSNEEKWLNEDTIILYEIADDIVKHHNCNY